MQAVTFSMYKRKQHTIIGYINRVAKLVVHNAHWTKPILFSNYISKIRQLDIIRSLCILHVVCVWYSKTLSIDLLWIFIFGIFFVFWVFFSVFVFHICICITQVPTAGLPGGSKHLACNLISDLLVTHTHPPHHSWLVLGQSFLLRLNEHSMMQILIGCFGCRLWWVWITFNPRLENSTNITSLFG